MRETVITIQKRLSIENLNVENFSTTENTRKFKKEEECFKIRTFDVPFQGDPFLFREIDLFKGYEYPKIVYRPNKTDKPMKISCFSFFMCIRQILNQGPLRGFVIKKGIDIK